MRTAYRISAVVVALVFLLVLTRLSRYQNGVPRHEDRVLPGGEPATLYLPGSSNEPGPANPFFNIFPSPVAQRPPAVVLVHGFTSDRVATSALARRIAQNGYGVLAIDVRGHGENRNSFFESTSGDGLREDVKNAVEFLRQSDLVDGSRIVVMGHSMGAGAVLDYATHDTNLKGAVMISGGFSLNGPEHPRNTLFIFAEQDPDFIKEGSALIAAHLAGVEKIDRGKVYGDVANGTAVEAIEVPGVNHARIIWSADAANSIVRWLDGVSGVKRPTAPNLAEPRLSLILICLPLFVLLLIPIGRVCAGRAGVLERRPADRTGWLGLAALLIALLIAMPLNANAPQALFLSLVGGYIFLSWFAVAGGLLIALLAVLYPDDLRRLGNGLGSTLFAAGLAFGAIVVVGAYDVSLHRTSLTPERMVVTAVAALLLLPFFISFEVMLRRGGTMISTVLGVLGRVVILIAIGIGLQLGIILFVIGLVMPVFVILFLMFEVFAASAYSVSANLLLIAIVESLWFARTAALSWPITFRF